MLLLFVVAACVACASCRRTTSSVVGLVRGGQQGEKHQGLVVGGGRLEIRIPAVGHHPHPGGTERRGPPRLPGARRPPQRSSCWLSSRQKMPKSRQKVHTTQRRRSKSRQKVSILLLLVALLLLLPPPPRRSPPPPPRPPRRSSPSSSPASPRTKEGPPNSPA